MLPSLFALARVIHLARVNEVSFKEHSGYSGAAATLARMPWPEDRAEAMRLFHAGQPWMDLAVAQARAVLKHQEQAA